MARARAAKSGTSAETNGTANADSAGALVCPECGRTFTRPAALGAHRRRAHGVVGQTNRGRGRRNAGRAASARPPRATRTAGTASPDGIDRDALLQALFPNGLPAREAVIRAANEWLD